MKPVYCTRDVDLYYNEHNRKSQYCFVFTVNIRIRRRRLRPPGNDRDVVGRLYDVAPRIQRIVLDRRTRAKDGRKNPVILDSLDQNMGLREIQRTAFRKKVTPARPEGFETSNAARQWQQCFSRSLTVSISCRESRSLLL